MVFAQGGPSGNNANEVMLGSPKVYLVFWGSQWGTETSSGGYDYFSGDPSGEAPILQKLFAGLGTDSEQWSTILEQYCSGVPVGTSICPSTAPHISYPTAPVLGGVWYDNSQAVPTSPSLNQVSAEATAAEAYFGDPNGQYFVMSPTGTHPDGFNCPMPTGTTPSTCLPPGQADWHSFCAEHSDTLTGYFPFTNFPYVTDMGQPCYANFVNPGVAGASDGVSIIASHEYAETMTDPYPEYGWSTRPLGLGEEIGDECGPMYPTSVGGTNNLTLATGVFPVTSLWSNATNSCEDGIPNTYTLTSASSFSAMAGAQAVLPYTLANTSGGIEPVTLSVSGLPPGAVIDSPTDAFSTTPGQLVVATADSTPPGTYPITITSEPNDVVDNTTLVVIPQNLFALSVPAVTASAGTSVNVTVSAPITSGVSRSYWLDLLGATPPGVTVSTAPSIVVTSVPGDRWGIALSQTGQSVRVTLNVSPTTPPGTYDIQLAGVSTTAQVPSGLVTQSAMIVLTVTPPSVFGVTPPTPAITTAGEGGSVPINTSVVSGPPQTVSLAMTGLPKGVSVSFLPSASVTDGQPASAVFHVSPKARPGTYHLTLTATGTSGQMRFPETLTVHSPTERFGARASVAVATKGRAGESRLVTWFVSGLRHEVSVSVRRAPAHVRVILSSSRFVPGRTLRISVVSSGARPGLYRVLLVLRGFRRTVGVPLVVKVVG
jgi:hypothetical protein